MHAESLVLDLVVYPLDLTFTVLFQPQQCILLPCLSHFCFRENLITQHRSHFCSRNNCANIKHAFKRQRQDPTVKPNERLKGLFSTMKSMKQCVLGCGTNALILSRLKMQLCNVAITVHPRCRLSSPNSHQTFKEKQQKKHWPLLNMWDIDIDI